MKEDSLNVGESRSVKTELTEVVQGGNDVDRLVDIIQGLPFPFELNEVAGELDGQISLDNMVLKVGCAARRKMKTGRTTRDMAFGGGAVAAGDGDSMRNRREDNEPIFD